MLGTHFGEETGYLGAAGEQKRAENGGNEEEEENAAGGRKKKAGGRARGAQRGPPGKYWGMTWMWWQQQQRQPAADGEWLGGWACRVWCVGRQRGGWYKTPAWGREAACVFCFLVGSG